MFVSGLTGPLRIFQRAGGHRHSIDDALTAWYALQKAPLVSDVLDLGTGIGTVGLITLWGLGTGATLTCVEAQEVSFGLLQANIACNGLEERVHAFHGDLRAFDAGKRFPLVTGSPPYFPQGEGTLPDDTQKAHARFELRGHVGDFLFPVFAEGALPSPRRAGGVWDCFPARRVSPKEPACTVFGLLRSVELVAPAGGRGGVCGGRGGRDTDRRDARGSGKSRVRPERHERDRVNPSAAMRAASSQMSA